MTEQQYLSLMILLGEIKEGFKEFQLFENRLKTVEEQLDWLEDESNDVSHVPKTIGIG